MNLKLHIAGLNFFRCDKCDQQFKLEEQTPDIICPNCQAVVPQENALSHRALTVASTDTVGAVKEQINKLYGVPTKQQNLLLIHSSFEEFIQNADDEDTDSDADSDYDEKESGDNTKAQPEELEDDQRTLADYGITDGAQLVNIIEKKL
jgi:hypothetical protein